MAKHPIRVHKKVQLEGGCMVVAFSGWMDGGNVSTGTVDHLVESLGALPLAEIDSEDFYIYSFPASMEVSALFRPHGMIEDGLVQSFEAPSNAFFVDELNRLVLFSGHEPNMRWREFADCVFKVAADVGVTRIYFVGSVGGMVPHTREPRLFSAVSAPRLKEDLESFGVRFTNYAGPVSIVTYMMTQAEERSMGMASVVAEIPAYVQGRNPRCVAAVARQITAILGLTVDLDPLRDPVAQWEKRLNEAVEERSELASHIRKLEEDYDNEIFDTQMGDLKDWLEQQGIRVD